ncbi:hypothetical protein FHS61_001217 [Altererythrobacter atlanticus]|uniref:Uncharacterized protein n=1 Tax=Croceibacterium atlanticum TaxID=1267766 RepID=A0A0F7KRI5_9SPHN|nr:hypothetical protein [Croceibacterium atlanticum]AKH43083.1 hypothetical protein WYH_02049 [Croceibacterium atlanticum]MBB5732213.1 hypothetical protein [Croceibacterium atlanticum]
MRFPLAITAVAPLALLAACGESAPEPAPEEVAAAPEEPAMPPVPADSLETLDYAGTYTLTRINGSKASLTLDAEGSSYTYIAANGKETEGSFTKVDGNRIMVEDFDGEPGYFAVAEGAIYYLPDAETSVDEIMYSNMYSLAEDDGAIEAADASSEMAADKPA